MACMGGACLDGVHAAHGDVAGVDALERQPDLEQISLEHLHAQAVRT